jgi:tRNA-splicing ligase RtcB
MQQLNSYSYEIAKEGNMEVPVKVFASEKLMEKMQQDTCLSQGKNVACMPGIQGWSIMMPDAHQGYGFSIGGVAAFDLETGVISPGGIGFDINCGVRVVATNLTKTEVQEKLPELLDKLFDYVPCGVGRESDLSLSDEELTSVLTEGARYFVKQEKGTEEDLIFCEEEGCMAEARPEFVPRRAKSRGRRQLGTLGAGNHFLEIQCVEDIVRPEVAKTFGITQKDQVVFMIHCGSRGLGHQVASDFLRRMEDEYPELIARLPEKDLAYAPLGSKLATDYYGAMCAAANFAFANRHMISYHTKRAFTELFPDVTFKPVYDVAHNIAKKELHTVNGEQKEVLVHRKGATRAFGPGSKDIPEAYRSVGQPVLLPGSMGTASYILVGSETAMLQSFGSSAHGAGRVMSRHAAKKQYAGKSVKEELAKNDILLKARNVDGVGDEAPGAYKDVHEVVKVTDEAGIGEIVVQLKPLGVIKG